MSAEEARRRDLAYELAVNASIPADLIPVLYQLLNGVVDATACRRLNISPRTFSRRVAEVLEQLGVATRFQGGAECGRRASMAVGWRSQDRMLAVLESPAVPAASYQDLPRSWVQDQIFSGCA
jgi:hypothetical protein